MQAFCELLPINEVHRANYSTIRCCSLWLQVLLPEVNTVYKVEKSVLGSWVHDVCVILIMAAQNCTQNKPLKKE